MTDSHLLAELALLATNLGLALRPAGLEELVRSITDVARRTFAAQASSIAILDEGADELVFYVASGGSDEVVGRRIPVGHGIAGWVVSSGQALAITEVSRDPRFAHEVAESFGYVPKAILAMPLETDRRLLGVIEVLDPTEDAAVHADMELLGVFARQAALAIQSVQSFDHIGQTLFAIIAEAAKQGDLGKALESIAGETSPSGEIAELASMFNELSHYGPEETQLATEILRSVLTHTRRARRLR